MIENFSPDFSQMRFQKKCSKSFPHKNVGVSFTGRCNIGEPAKSESAIAKRLGVSQQFLNKQLKKGKNCFVFKETAVLVLRQMEFLAAGKEFETQNQMADALGLSRSAVARVFKTGTSGVVKNKEGKEVKISRIKGSTFVPACPKPIPAIRVRSAVGGIQEFSSISAASRELKIDPKTIPSALRSGRDSFTRRSDGQKFTVEIPEGEAPQQVPPRIQKFRRPAVRVEDEEPPEESKRSEETKAQLGAQRSQEPEVKPKEDPFESELWKLFPDLPRNSDVFFNKNKHRIIPEGYKVKKKIQ